MKKIITMALSTLFLTQMPLYSNTDKPESIFSNVTGLIHSEFYVNFKSASLINHVKLGAELQISPFYTPGILFGFGIAENRPDIGSLELFLKTHLWNESKFYVKNSFCHIYTPSEFYKKNHRFSAKTVVGVNMKYDTYLEVGTHFQGSSFLEKSLSINTGMYF